MSQGLVQAATSDGLAVCDHPTVEVCKGVTSMRCDFCDGMKIWPEFNPDNPKTCPECKGTGRIPNDDLGAKLREAIAKIGMVYFVRDDISQRIKIGTSLNPLGRLNDLQTGSSVRLRIMAMCGGGRKAEREFHQIFAKRRLQGEWFDDADREISRIVFVSVRGSGVIWPDEREP